jgi:hypothetical protein
MKHYLSNHKVIAAIVALVGLLVLSYFWSLSASIRGHIAARIDIRRGQYQVLGYGLPSRSRPEYARCLRKRDDIDFRPVAGCIVSDSLISYVKAYHSVVVEATTLKFGHDVFQECADEADRKWNEKRETVPRDVIP